MNKFIFSFIAIFIWLPVFAQYTLIEDATGGRSLYFNTKLENVDGIIYTALIENFATPRKLLPSEVISKENGELY